MQPLKTIPLYHIFLIYRYICKQTKRSWSCIVRIFVRCTMENNLLPCNNTTSSTLSNDTVSMFNLHHLSPLIRNDTFPHFGHSLGKQFPQAAGFSFLAIIIVALFCNLVLISLIVFIRRLHSVLHVFIVNLAVSDLITAIGSIPFDVEYMFRGYFPHSKSVCELMNTVFFISLPSSVLSLTLLSIERLIVVAFPYRVNDILSKKVVGITLGVVWCYVLLVALFPVMVNKNAAVVSNGSCSFKFPVYYSIFMMIVNFVIPILIICGSNIVLFRIAQKQHRKHTRAASRFRQSSLLPSKSKKGVFHNKQMSHLRQIRSVKLTNNIRAAKRIGLLVGVFLFCWLSYIIIVASNFICWCQQEELTWIANIINYASTAINPILYGLLNKTIRREMLKVLQHEFKHGSLKMVLLKNQKTINTL